MNTRLNTFAAAFALTALLAACGGGGGGSSGSGYTPPGGGVSSTPPPGGVGTNTIGISLPSGAIGTVKDPTYGVVGGYTQTVYSQVLAFPVGTTVTLKNLSSTTPHTLNVLSTSAFPANPTPSTSASGSSSLDGSYASGSISPGGSVTVTLATAGTYYIGCAYHYFNSPSMRDVLVVGNATPGPQATPQAGSSGTPGPGGY